MHIYKQLGPKPLSQQRFWKIAPWSNHSPLPTRTWGRKVRIEMEDLSSLTEGLFYDGKGLKVRTREELLSREEKWRVFQEERGSTYEPTAAFTAFIKNQNQKSRSKERKARGRARAQVRHYRQRPGARTKAQDPLQTFTEDC